MMWRDKLACHVRPELIGPVRYWSSFPRLYFRRKRFSSSWHTADSSGGVSVDPVTLLAIRMGLSLPLFAIIGRWSSRNALQALNRRDWIALIIIGLMGY